MPNIYCPSCGTGIKFMYTKPSECSNCSYVFATVVSTPSKRSKFQSVDEDEDEDEEEYIPRKKAKKIRSLSFIVDKPQFEKFGEVVGSSPGEERISRQGVSKERLKDKIFKSEPTSIDNA